MAILIDMNLSPYWVDVLRSAGFEAVHWSAIGPVNATDKSIMDWALENNHVIFTHDLDFSAILSATNAKSPSVFQVRTQDTMPQTIGLLVVQAFKQFATVLEEGALVTLDAVKSRARVLPLH